MSRKALMAAAAAVIIVGSVAVVAIGPARLSPLQQFPTTREQLSSTSGSRTAPATPVSTTAPVGPTNVSNQTAAVPSPPEQLRSDLPVSGLDVSQAAPRTKTEHANASTGQPAAQAYDSVVADEEAAPYWSPPSSADERYGDFKTNPVKLVSEEPVSTFSIDVDTA